jgi:competence-damaged protein
MDELLPLAEQIGQLLIAPNQTIAVAESSAGGLISTALLSVPGASAYFIGGVVVYTRTSRTALLDISEAALEGIRPSTEAYALLLARSVRARLGTVLLHPRGVVDSRRIPTGLLRVVGIKSELGATSQATRRHPFRVSSQSHPSPMQEYRATSIRSVIAGNAFPRPVPN